MKIEIVTNVKVGKYGTYIQLANDETTKNISVYPSKNMEEQDMFTKEGVYKIYGDLTLNNKGLPCIYCTKWEETNLSDSCILTCKVRYNEYGAFTVIRKKIKGEFISVLLPLNGLTGSGKPEILEVLGILTLSKKGKIELSKCNRPWVLVG